MYDELLKDLREGAEFLKCSTPGIKNAYAKMLHNAADAIEELSAIREEQKAQIILMGAEIEELKTYSELYQSLTDKSQKTARNLLDAYPKWIPVTERLPEDGIFVLVCNDDRHMMIAKHETETYEWYYKYTNYDFDIWDNEEQGPVRYWMPLPEPPMAEEGKT